MYLLIAHSVHDLNVAPFTTEEEAISVLLQDIRGEFSELGILVNEEEDAIIKDAWSNQGFELSPTTSTETSITYFIRELTDGKWTHGKW